MTTAAKKGFYDQLLFFQKRIEIQLAVSNVKFYRATCFCKKNWCKYTDGNTFTLRSATKQDVAPGNDTSIQRYLRKWKQRCENCPSGMQLFHLMGHYIIAILVQWTSQMEEDMLGGVFCWAKQVFWKMMEDTCGRANSTLKSMMWGMDTGRKRWCSERCIKGFQYGYREWDLSVHYWLTSAYGSVRQRSCLRTETNWENGKPDK